MASVVAIGVAAAPRIAMAASYGLSWEGTCATPEAVEAAVVERLGRDPFVPDADVVLEGRDLPPRAGRVRARVEQRARDGRVLGSRDLEAASCEELGRSAAFVIVLIVDPDALLRDPEPPPPKSLPPAPPARVHPRAPTPPRRRPPARSIVSAGAGATFATGLLPGGDVGGAVILGVSPWRLPVRFEWRGSYHTSLASPRGRGFSAFEQEWRACYRVGARAALGAAGCVGGAWAAIVPQTVGLQDGDQASKGVVGPLIALGPSLRLGEYGAFAELSVFAPEPRYLFSYLDDAGTRRTLHELDRFVLSVTIGVTRAF